MKQLLIKASLIKNDATLFIVFSCNFSNFLVIFLVSGSKVYSNFPISST